MGRANLVVLALSGVVLGGAPALAADRGPVIVLPGRHGMPVIINGIDVTGMVIEGDWGLSSPQMVNPTIIPAPVLIPGRFHQGSYEGGYFPAWGREPGYGRHEIEPPADRRLPAPATSFHRFWSSHSDPLPANLDSPAQSPPWLVAPQIYPGGRRDADPPPGRR